MVPFLETQFSDIAHRLSEEKLLDITRKTLRKMSSTAIEHALRLPLDPADRALIERALANAD